MRSDKVSWGVGRIMIGVRNVDVALGRYSGLGDTNVPLKRV